ncbi:MAG: hypothetical protein WCB93_04865, partial [Gallionella sp.]
SGWAYRQARYANAREIGQITMNQCRLSSDKARIIRKEKIKASGIYVGLCNAFAQRNERRSDEEKGGEKPECISYT